MVSHDSHDAITVTGAPMLRSARKKPGLIRLPAWS